MRKINELYPLDENDIKAIGGNRVAKAEGNKPTYWMVGGMLVMVAGASFFKSIPILQWGLIIVGAVALIYSTNSVVKKQKSVANDLINQWRAKINK